MNITSRDSRGRPYSVSSLTAFFETRAKLSKVEYRFHWRKPKCKPRKVPDEVRCAGDKEDDINKLKDGHLVSERRKLFESNLEENTKKDNAPDHAIDQTDVMFSIENAEVTAGINQTADAMRRSEEQKSRHSLEDIQKVRRSVMDTIIKYIQEGVSDNEEEDDICSPEEMSENEIEECEHMMKQLPTSWRSMDCINSMLPKEDLAEDLSDNLTEDLESLVEKSGEELVENKGEDLSGNLKEDLGGDLDGGLGGNLGKKLGGNLGYFSNNLNKSVDTTAEIAQCIEEVRGEYNNLIALAEHKDTKEVNVRRSGNFLKSNRSSSKRKKIKKVTEDVVYPYRRIDSDDSTKSECKIDKTENEKIFDTNSFFSSPMCDVSEDMFGAVTDINDFIVETYNNREENVLFKLTLQREPILIPSSNEVLKEEKAESLHTEIKIDVKINTESNHRDQEHLNEEICAKYENVLTEEDHAHYENLMSNTNGYINPTYENVIIFNDDNKKQQNVYENWTIYDKAVEGSYYDKDLNPRIMITCESSTEELNKDFLEVPKRVDIQLPSPTPKKQHIIEELQETEKKYLNGLEYVIHQYLKHFINHPDVKHIGAGIRTMFGNIEDIYRATENFYKKLLECECSVERIARLFLENEKLFLLCSDYMRNKSKTQHIYEQFSGALSERQRQLNDKKTCDSYLLTPVQRPTRYKLLLENLSKDMKKHGEESSILDEAIAFIDKNISEANRLLAVDSIRGCPIDLTNKGPLLLKDSFNIKRKYRSFIFLFRDVVVFTSESKLRQDTFDYKDSILSLDLSLKHQTNSNTFVLINFPRSKKEKNDDGMYRYEIEAATLQICSTWVNEIRKMLWMQLNNFKDLQAKKLLIENHSPIKEQKFCYTPPAADKKKKNNSLGRTSIFYISENSDDGV